MIGVKNKGSEPLKARYDGQNFVFEPDAITACSEDAARHIFGYGEKDKTRALHRLGWLRHGGEYEAGLEKLNAFVFLAVEEVKFKEEPSPTTLHLPNKLDKVGMTKPPEGERHVAVK